MENRLIELLAETDAIFEPIRDWGNPANVAAVLERRDDFRRVGLQLPKCGGDANERKQAERELDKMERSGDVTFPRRSGKRSSWKLTAKAYWKLRRLAMWSDYPEAVAVLQSVAKLTDKGHSNSDHVPEWSLALTRGDDGQSEEARDKCWIVGSEYSVPCLVFGWLTSWLDQNGAVGLRITKSGRKFLANPEEPLVDWPEYNSDANDLYLSALSDARSNLRSLKPTKENTVPIPLGCGSWPDKKTRGTIPPIIINALTKI